MNNSEKIASVEKMYSGRFSGRVSNSKIIARMYSVKGTKARVISEKPRLIIKEMRKYSIIDLDFITCNYRFNFDGGLRILDETKKYLKYIHKDDSAIIKKKKFIPGSCFIVKILKEYADELAKNFLEIAHDITFLEIAYPESAEDYDKMLRGKYERRIMKE